MTSSMSRRGFREGVHGVDADDGALDGVLVVVVLGVAGVGGAAEQAIGGLGVVVPPAADAVVADGAGQGVVVIAALGEDVAAAGEFLLLMGAFVADDAEGPFRVAADGDGGVAAGFVVFEGRPDQRVAFQGLFDKEPLRRVVGHGGVELWRHCFSLGVGTPDLGLGGLYPVSGVPSWRGGLFPVSRDSDDRRWAARWARPVAGLSGGRGRLGLFQPVGGGAEAADGLGVVPGVGEPQVVGVQDLGALGVFGGSMTPLRPSGPGGRRPGWRGDP